MIALVAFIFVVAMAASFVAGTFTGWLLACDRAAAQRRAERAAEISARGERLSAEVDAARRASGEAPWRFGAR